MTKKNNIPPIAGIGEEKKLLIESFALMLESGLPIQLGLTDLRREVQSARLRRVIDYIQEQMDAGEPLWQILQRLKLFPEHIISLIRTGEQTGALGENLRVVLSQQQKEQLFRSKVQSAVAYPLLVLTVTVIVGLGIAWFILPKLATIFDQLRINLPLSTKVLIGVGNFLRDYGVIAVPLILVGTFLLIYLVFFAPKTRVLGEKILFQIPIARTIIQHVQIARFCFLSGTLLEAGLPIDKTFDSVIQTTTHHAYRRLFSFLGQQIAEGDTFAEAFKKFPGSHRLIPSTVQQMITTAERTGKLSPILLKISQYYEEKIDVSTKNLATIIEPVLLVLVWLAVVFVVVAVILPIYQITGNLQTGPQTNQPVASPAPTSSLAPSPDASPLVEPSPLPSLEPLELPTVEPSLEPSPAPTSEVSDATAE